MQGIFVKSPVLKIVLGILSTLAAIVLVLLVLVTEEVRMEHQTENWEGRAIENGAILFANNCASCHGPDGKGLPGVAPALNSHYFFTDTGRLRDVGWAGTLEDYVALTVAAGRPSKTSAQWAQIMPTWGEQFGGPLRGDQVDEVTAYVLNYREGALAQTPEEDPFQPFTDVSTPVEHQNIETVAARERGEELPEVAASTSEAGGSGGPRDPADLWVSMGCGGCHNLEEDQTADNRGVVAPHQGNLAERAGERVEGQSAEEYIYNSIVNPNDFVVEGYVAGVMPDFSERMSEEEIQAMVAWLLEQTSE